MRTLYAQAILASCLEQIMAAPHVPSFLRTKTAGRQPTNLPLNAALVATARELKVNLSEAAEHGIASAVAAQRRELWLAANRAALASSNDYVESFGLPLARHRGF